MLKGVIPLTLHKKSCLAPYQTQFRALANRKVSRKRKKTYLTQRGGARLRFILPSALVLGMKHSKKIVLIWRTLLSDTNKGRDSRRLL